MKRRKFLQTSSRAVAVPMLLNGLSLTAVARSSIFNVINPESDRVLVLIQLNGGNDGLNMVIPVDQYDGLANVRANVLLPQSSLLPLNDLTALHPAMTGVRALYDQGKLNIVQSAGYPNQDRSHFRSTDIWTTGSPADEFWRTGWLGRHMDGLYPGFPDGYPNGTYPHPFAITMGSLVSETCQGTVANYSMVLNDPFSLSPLLEGEPGTLPNTPYGEELQFLRTSISQTNAYGEVITEAANLGSNTVTYPDSRLAAQLRNVALLIAGGLQTKIYVVNIGGFDTHANQVVDGDPTAGEHAELLQQLSDAMAAFQTDLQGLGVEERVVSMTFSEFGRRIRSNDSFGTDHGTAAPLLVFGSCVNAQILGNNPEISTDVDDQEGVAMQHDFRDVYGSILMDWFEVEEAEVRNLLYPEFSYLPILRNCSVVNNQEVEASDPVTVEVFPNPMRDRATVRFESKHEWVRVSVYNAVGAEVRNLTNQRLQAGEHQIGFDARGLAAGVYFVRVQLEGRVSTRRVVVQ